MTTDQTPNTALTIDEYHSDLEAHWSRNRISRRSALKGALVGAGAIALVNFPSLKKSFAAGGGVSGPSGANPEAKHSGQPNPSKNKGLGVHNFVCGASTSPLICRLRVNC